MGGWLILCLSHIWCQAITQTTAGPHLADIFTAFSFILIQMFNCFFGFNVLWVIIGTSYGVMLNQRWHSSTLVQGMAWWRQVTSHYLSQCWPRSMSPYSTTRPQWVNKPKNRLIWFLTWNYDISCVEIFVSIMLCHLCHVMLLTSLNESWTRQSQKDEIWVITFLH